jgi:eukaryotic-like serine/threonine-protein kinase
MAPESSVLLDVAQSVADGTPVDWPTAETRASPEEQPAIRQLRILADLAALHRTAPVPGAVLAATERGTVGPPGLAHWGHLAIGARLGGGSDSDVYRAWDPGLEREVALKLLRAGAACETLDASRLAREGRLLARIRHRHVVSVHGVTVRDGRVGLWMELVQGSTLEQILLERGWFSARETMLIGIDLCGALAAIHGAGLVHGDIKTQNVLREDGGRIVLMDMGAGGEMRSRRHSDRIVGTPLYLAPETFSGAPPTAAGDIYSLGVLLYRLVTGSFPVGATAIEELRAAHAARRQTKLRDVRPDLPLAFVRAIERATAPDPAKRYTTAGAFETDLLRAFDRPGTPAAALTRVWRHPAVAVLGALVILLAGIVPLWRHGRLAAWAETAETAPLFRSIAVLPFANATRNSSDEYLADGITEEVIARLGQVPGLDVISRASVMAFKERLPTVPDVAKTLGVDAVLQGSVLVQRRDPNSASASDRRVRIAARLIRAGGGAELWSRTFEGPIHDLSTLQGEIARAIVMSTGGHLPDERTVAGAGVAAATSTASTPARGIAAIDLYLQGRYYWHLQTEEGFKRSIQYFDEAIDRDPSYARAYAGLSDAYYQLGWMGIVPSNEAFDRAHAAALRALEVDRDLPEALASLAFVQMRHFEWQAAGENFRRAVEAKPGYAIAHLGHAVYLTARGQLDAALDRIRRARILDPLSQTVAAQHALVLLYSRQPDAALVEIERLIAANPDRPRPHLMAAEAHRQRGALDRALTEAKTARQLGDRTVYPCARIGVIHAMQGRRLEARRMIAELEASYKRGEQAAGAVAAIYVALGDEDAAFTWLARARDARDPFLAYLLVSPVWDTLRPDPRFHQIAAALGLEE